MKVLGSTQQILDMKIICDKKAKRLFLSQQNYVGRLIKHFKMRNANLVNILLANHFKLSKSLNPSSKKEIEEMEVNLPPYVSSMKFHVHNGVYKTRYCS